MNSYRKGALFLGDILCFVVGFGLFTLVAFGTNNAYDAALLHAAPFLIIVVLWLCVLFIFNFYELRTSKPNMIFVRNFCIAAIIMLGIGFIYFYIDPATGIAPKSNLVIFELLSLVLIFIWRRIFYMATLNTPHTRFAIVCSEKKFHALISEMALNPQLGFRNCGTYTTLADFAQAKQEIDLLIVHKTDEQESHLLEKVLASHIQVIDLAEAYETILYKIPVDFIDNQWLVRSVTKRSHFAYSAISRVVSILFAVVVGIIMIPISLIIMIAIKLEDGGAMFYTQTRTGLHGKIFRLYKFRSMTNEAEINGAQWAETHDARVTRVGAIIRKLHIDEIPQMINLLKGDITLVGPRPERPQFVRELENEIPYYFMRHTIAPGFTGWAQIKFRYARTIMDSQEKFEYDLYYIKNRNFFLDLGIIMKTVQIIFTH